jgi:hypothetical protein
MLQHFKNVDEKCWKKSQKMLKEASREKLTKKCWKIYKMLTKYVG